MLDQILPRSRDEALKTYCNPDLRSFRPEVTKAWGQAFRDEVLLRDVLQNPRLTDRILTDIFACVEMERVVEPPEEELSIVYGLLLSEGYDRLCRALGVAYFRATMIDWLTWNLLEEKLTEFEPAMVRKIILSIDDVLSSDAELPDEVFRTLDQETIMEAGMICLTGWLGGIDANDYNRLSLFLKLPTTQARSPMGQIVPAVAAAIDPGASE